MKKLVIKKKALVKISFAFLILVASFTIINLFTATPTLSNIEEAWDGVDVATSFSAGNGTQENPYQIQTGSQIAYLKKITEEKSIQNLKDKYFVLTEDVDLGGNDWTGIGTEDTPFTGHLDGQGYTIKNFKIENPTIINDIAYYGFFSVIEDAEIKNINFYNGKILTKMTNTSSNIGLIASSVKGKSTLNNIAIQTSTMDLSKIYPQQENKIGGTFAEVSEQTTVENIYNQMEITDVNGNSYGSVFGILKGKATNIITQTTFTNFLSINISFAKEVTNQAKLENTYKLTSNNDNLYFLDNTEMTIDELLELLNNKLEGTYAWHVDSGHLKISNQDFLKTQTSSISQTPSLFSFGRSVSISLHETGIEGNTVYINDLESDYNYYLGLNYTESTTGTLPSGYSQNKYNDTNLVKVYMKYSGTDISDSSITGNISLEEQQSNLIYYKYYPVENGYVNVELIDNPYADRPNDKAFNGWITDYQGAKTYFDEETYTRYVRIPVTYSNTTPNTINITMYASWITATTQEVTTNSNWSSVFANLSSPGMLPIKQIIYQYEDMSSYYTQGTIGFLGSYPSGALNSSGNRVSGMCLYGSCTYYLPSGKDYIEGEEYFKLEGNRMVSYTPQYQGSEIKTSLPIGSSAAGLYQQTTVTGGQSIAGLYDGLGNYQESGTCNTTSGCTYYDLVQFYDNNGNTNIVEEDNNLYYLVTRDTNIIVLTAQKDDNWTANKPFTLTGINNGKDYSDTRLQINSGSLTVNQDARIEWLELYSNVRKSTDDGDRPGGNQSTGAIYANWNNLKIGRGIKETTNRVNAATVVAGNGSATGTASNLTRYKLIVESGIYNTTSATNGTQGRTIYVDGTVVYGNDFDRVTNNNDNLEIIFCASGSWGDNVYSSSQQTGIALHTIVKSGSFGTNESSYSTGIYIGGREGGTHYAARDAIIEGGDIYNLIGGPLTATGRTNINDTYINIKGGTIDVVIGGAGASETYGNRIINMTGGTVNYGVFGGSNGVEGSDSGNYKGTLSGTSFVYIGGNAVVGDDELISRGSSEFGVSSGNVFGIGNGNTSSTQVGSADSSNVIIDGNATIKSNVYGGGNYGATGLVPYQNKNGTKESTTNIKILGGTVKGSVYGGGNNNGSGGTANYRSGRTTYTTTVTSNINIEMYGGTVGNVYGGSRVKGTVYGDSNTKIYGGTITNDVYGGGEGGYRSSGTPGTYVEDNVAVTIGTVETSPTINGSVYGGSAYGTVNGTAQGESANEKSTTVTIENGIIKGSVFGGGKGSNQYTPRVYGNVTVLVNNGNIGKVFGGNDASGSPSNKDYVYLTGGTIGDAFGGGNNTGQTTTNIYLQGATVSKLYGGSNQSGSVETTNVQVTNGTADYVYGGNNLGGTTTTNNVEISGGTVTSDVYGGGSLARTTTTKLTLGSAEINNVYGGGEQASATTTTTEVNRTKITNLYGGSNKSGNVTESTISIISGTLTNIYGGNNLGGSTYTTNIVVEAGEIGTIYGGGNKATTGYSNIAVESGIIKEIYGGGNEAGLTMSDIDLKNGDIGNVYGGSNKSGNIENSNIDTANKLDAVGTRVEYKVEPNTSGHHEAYKNQATITVTLVNRTSNRIDAWEVHVNIPESTKWITPSNISLLQYNTRFQLKATGQTPIPAYGTREVTFSIFTNQESDDFNISEELISPGSTEENNDLHVDNIFGGNNKGGRTTYAFVNAANGYFGSVYGGGNEAPVTMPILSVQSATVNYVYGGGNMATINGDTKVTVTNSKINGNIYGGGNYGTVTGSTTISLATSTILGSAYGGGNGSSATVSGNTTITMENNSIIGTSSSKTPQEGCLFGGGNAAATGTEASNNSKATVNIVGGTIYGNVYGGANTSVVYGETDINIGSNVVKNPDLAETDIDIRGTIFGGGEANAAGDENYDFSFISVTGAIDIDIDGKDYDKNNHKFLLSGSIFGSGNASSSSGISNIYITNLGTRENPSQNISIQRANKVIIDNAVMELSGATDRTNEYSDIEYSLNRIDELNIKNNTVLLLQRNANLLQKLKSTVDISSKEQKAAVIINDDTKEVTKNVDNRIYMLANRNLNVTTNEAATEYGEVSGMTFFGMYQKYGNGTFVYGLYGDEVNYGDEGDAGDIIMGGSYVLGLHKVNHDITIDGFYSNFIDEEYTEISTQYIEPTPQDSNYYMWTIGISAINYSFTMTASKYSSLGTYELSMREFAKGDTSFEVIGFSSEGLTSGVGLIDSNNVPKVADTEADANSLLGLSMKAETSEWTSYRTTKFLSENSGKYTGDKDYKTDSQALAPSLMFYLYHAKNISLNQELGTVVITMQALTKKNEIEYDIQLITITIDLVAKNYDDGNSYDASITYDKKYEMPAATSVHITNQSQFTAYFDLYAEDTFENLYGRGNTNYHALVTDYALPVGTQVTMLDYSAQDGTPEYYYYTITEEDYATALEQLAVDNEITYRISKFIKMGSTDKTNTYQEQEANEKYYDEQRNRTIEEFLFIFDFKETNTTGSNLNKYMRFELRNNEDRTVVTVLGIRQNYMYFNLYDSSNMVLKQNVNFDTSYIYPDMARHISYETAVTYNQTANRESIINTNYESTSMGLNVALFDNSGNQISSSLLTGTSIRMDGVEYFADSEGVFRIKLSGKVANLKKDLYFLTDETLPSGKYKIKFSLFASSDGLHNSGGLDSVEVEKEVTVVPAGNAIEVVMSDEDKVVDGLTRENENNQTFSRIRVNSNQTLTKPNIRVSVYKRDIDNKDTMNYQEIDFNQVFMSVLQTPEAQGYISQTAYERFYTTRVLSQISMNLEYAPTLTSGTYKIEFKLYDDNQLISSDEEYMIIKK